MASVKVKNASGADAGTVELDETYFGIEPNVPVMHQVVTAQLAAKRSGTQSTKTRSEVAGGGAKPWKQKGTGRARAGSIRAPQWKGGGVALGPKPRSYAQKTPKKMIRLALRSALSDRAAEEKIIVVDDWGFDTPRTKDAIAALSAIGVEGRALVVLKGDDIVTWKCFRNLTDVHLIEADQLNAYDVLCSDVVVFTKDTLPATDTDAPIKAKAKSTRATKADAEPKATPAAKPAAKPKAAAKPKPAPKAPVAAAEATPPAEPAPTSSDASSEEADDMATDLPNRPPSEQKRTAPIKDTDRVKSAQDKLDPRFEAARAKAAKEEALRAKATEAKASSDADEVKDAPEEAPAEDAPKKSGGFSFTNTNEEDEA